MSRRISFPLLCLALLGSLVLGNRQARSLSAPGQGAAVICPAPTHEPPPVIEPVTSPTNLWAQTIYIGFEGEWVRVINEGVDSVMCSTKPCNAISIWLKPNAVNHLEVEGRVPTIVKPDGCVYMGYTLSVRTDRNGNPLEIEQVTGNLYRLFLPAARR